jgi:hypothetical protein
MLMVNSKGKKDAKSFGFESGIGNCSAGITFPALFGVLR